MSRFHPPRTSLVSCLLSCTSPFLFLPSLYFCNILHSSAPPDTQRACLLSNVCLNDAGEIEFYLHPRSAILPKNYMFNELIHGLVRLEGIGGMPWSPFVKKRAMPSDFEFNEDADVHLFTSFVANNNFGHNLIDNVFTHYFSMQHFDVGGYNSSRLISEAPCVSVKHLHGICCFIFRLNSRADPGSTWKLRHVGADDSRHLLQKLS